MPNIFKNQEQRDHWNEYNKKYAKDKYKSINIKLDKKEYAKEIDYLTKSPLGASGEIKKILREKIRAGE